MVCQHSFLVFFSVILCCISNSWSLESRNAHRFRKSTKISTDRRHFFTQLVSNTAVSSLLLLPEVSNAAAVRAVGSGEYECLQKGNCLDIGEYDGAVGWTWGGKDRCDPSDPKCGPGGVMREALVGKPVPEKLAEITHVAIIRVDIGREESSTLKIGLYGNNAPGAVEELVAFLSEGLSTMTDRQQIFGSQSIPVSLVRGGLVTSIVPGLMVEFGVPRQSYAYARSIGKSKADGFLPQPRPNPSRVAKDQFVRSHDVAGLLSVPAKGLGYGGTGFESDDEAFESSFLITADKVPSLDKSRRVVGQVLDNESMAFLERLSSLATKRGIAGVIPGQTSGPPLLKTVVRNIDVSKVSQQIAIS